MKRSLNGWLARFAPVVVLAVGCLCTSAAHAVVVWNEGVNGDISGNRLAPSSAALVLGSNTLTATSQGPSATADREYITFSMPPGTHLSRIFLQAYNSLDGVAFIAVQSGTTMTEPPTGTNAGNLLGYAHFGSAINVPGENIMPDMASGYDPGFEAMGFDQPLPAGNFTFWIQQTGANPATYTFDFFVVPEPASLVLIGLYGAILFASKRRRVALG